eukprot:CAMPEP_0119039066 /NCGR_PEP_ID=MMETSP1177-20130426/8365_1 /TAXON_ID=2985 /ORGANISM="Ochromonas sp, Strain CCMP1899" /LENGTH=392 /DNA_ID=CAMNT_0007002487 /DNA_START=320 /DNA_END=1498 /DNA_ORIENTATION=+
MEEWGNGRANQYYESNTPENVYFPKETDSVKIIEKFIRNKYEHKKYISNSIPPKKQSLQEVDTDHSKSRKSRTKRTKPKLSKHSDTGADVEPIIKSTVKNIALVIQESPLIDLIDFDDEPQESSARPIVTSVSYDIQNIHKNEIHAKEILPGKELNLMNSDESDLIDFGDDTNVPFTQSSMQQQAQQPPEFARNQQNMLHPSPNILSPDSFLATNTKAETFSASILSLYDFKDSCPPSDTVKKEVNSIAINLNGNMNENNRNGSTIHHLNAMNGGMNMNSMQHFNNGLLSNHSTASQINNSAMMSITAKSTSNKPVSTSSVSNQNGSTMHSQHPQYQVQSNNQWQQLQPQQQHTNMMRGTVIEDKRLYQNHAPHQQYQEQSNPHFHINNDSR